MSRSVSVHDVLVIRRALPAGLYTVRTERQALEELERALAASPLDRSFEEAARLIVQASGRVLVTGMGKSGLVGRRLAATFASTGTPSFFIHPAEASHGDLGMITADDILLALSWSGETTELSDIIAYCRRFAVSLIAITSCSDSTLAKSADIVLLLPKVEEACPNRLAPTSSTALQSTIGDALAVSLIELRGFSREDFHVFHPKGKLGAQLLSVRDVMSTPEAVPIVTEGSTILTAMMEMSLKRFGVTGVVDSDGSLVGAFSDGDLRRSLTVASVDDDVTRHMTLTPLTIRSDRPASEALAMMNARSVMQLFVCEDERPVGILHVHDILRAGVV